MNRSDRERLIERYLSGEMTSHNEEEFFIQVALNEEMRQELKAHRAIESSIRKEREAERPEHTALRQRVAACVVANPMPMPPGEPAGISGGATFAAGAAPAAGGVAVGIWQGWWWIASAITLIAVAGSLLLRNGTSSTTTPIATLTSGVHSASYRFIGSSFHLLVEQLCGAAIQPKVVAPDGYGLAGGITEITTNPPQRRRPLHDRSVKSRTDVGVFDRTSSSARRSAKAQTTSHESNSLRQELKASPERKRRLGDSIPLKIKLRILPTPH